MAERPAQAALTTRGKETGVCISLMRPDATQLPANDSFVVGATPAAKGATAIALATAITVDLTEGQGLQFADSDGVQYYALVSANVDSGETSIAVKPLDEAIPTDATAVFPPRTLLRTSANLSVSVETEDINTFDHKSTSRLQTGSSAEFTTDGLYSPFDPGYRCFKAAVNQGLRLYVVRTFAAPSDKYVSGERDEFFAIPSSGATDSPVDGSVTANLSFVVDGEVVNSMPVPVA